MTSRHLKTIFVAAIVSAVVASGSSAVASEGSAATQEKDTITVETCSGGAIELSVEERRSLTLHNDKRREKDLEPFCVNPILTKVARAHAQDMLDRDYFAHNTPEGVTPVRRLKQAGYIIKGELSYWTVGENIAWGSGDLGSPDNIFKAWINSEGHRHNILDKDFQQIGIGMSQGAFEAKNGNVYGDARMYAAEFGARREKSR